MPKITKIRALEILDSRGNPTLKVTVFSGNKSASASVPSGASTGKYEALELRDGDLRRYKGKGVLKAIKNIENIIAPKLKGIDVNKQEQIDRLMIKIDGTRNKSRLGANAILGVSLACARLAAKVDKLELYKYIYKQINADNNADKRRCNFPCPMFNVINGGRHSDAGLDIQEFMIIPYGLKTFHEQLRAGKEIFRCLKKILIEKKLSVKMGDEGGFAPRLKNSEQVFQILLQAIKKAGYEAAKEIFIGIDAASSEFFKNGFYNFENKKLNSQQMIGIYEKWIKKYPIISIEDGLAEDDWKAWVKFSYKIKSYKVIKLLLIGDDLFTTNIERLKKGIKLGAANAILIKPNQIGTLTETINCIKLAQKNKYKIIVSHRSGETNDDFIADLAVGVGAEFIKSGAPSKKERLVKYERLLEIENKYNLNTGFPPSRE